MTRTGERTSQAGVSGSVPTDEELLIARDAARLIATVAAARRDR
jgi:acetate kinase